MNLLDIRYKIERSWSKETTFCPDTWSEDNPAHGQCAVSSLLVHEILTDKGFAVCKLIKCKVNGTLHYFNLINGVVLDLTWRQFDIGSEVTEMQHCDRYELLDTEWKKECFDNLKNSFYEKKI